jgi:hypothetical protein
LDAKVEEREEANYKLANFAREINKLYINTKKLTIVQ